MQSLMFLKSTDDGPIDRIINIDLISTAYPNPDGEGTIVIVGNASISMGMPFAEFVKKIEFLIAENYRIGTESSLKWHEKRMADAEKTLKNTLKDLKT